MKVLFLHLGRESLGVEYLSAALKSAGHETALGLDPGLFGENDNVFFVPRLARFFDQRERLARLVRKSRTDVVAFSVYTNSFGWCLEMAREVRRAGRAKIVMGGPHVTLVPEVVARQPEVDFAVAGEAEEAVVELVDAIERGWRADRIANVWTKRDGKALGNPVRPPIQDLDSLPLPDKALFEKDINFEDDYLVLGSRGCVYDCSYCCESFLKRLYQGRYYRRRSPEAIVAELRLMRERYGFREVMFNDAVLGANREWLGELMTLYRRHVRVPFRCFGEVRLLTEEVARVLRFGGCYAIEFGVQSMNEDVRRRILNRRETNEQNARAFALCDELGIRYDVDHIFGLPEESVDDHRFAARFYSGLKRLNRIKVHNLTCFPRTGMERIMRERGLLTDEAVANMEMGRTGDFFHVDEIRDPDAARVKHAFAMLYKVLPALPRKWVARIVEGEGYRSFGRIPKPLIVAAQALIGLKHLDYRFWLYIKYYVKRLSRWARTHASWRAEV